MHQMWNDQEYDEQPAEHHAEMCRREREREAFFGQAGWSDAREEAAEHLEREPTENGGSYDLGAAGRFCKHFLNGLADLIPCPSCNKKLTFDGKQAAIPVFVCTGSCIFSMPNAPIDARLILRILRNKRQENKESS